MARVSDHDDEKRLFRMIRSQELIEFFGDFFQAFVEKKMMINGDALRYILLKCGFGSALRFAIQRAVRK